MSAISLRVRALQLLWRAAPGLSVLALIFVVAEGALPVLTLVAMGRVTGFIPAAVAHGLSSPDGHRLVRALAEAGGIYALSLMRGPFEDALTSAASARIDAQMQRQLVDAVGAPVGIEHLEDRDTLEQLSSARGELLGSDPSTAPMAVVSSLGDRLTGILACVAVMTFRWWLGLGLLVMWLAIRRPLGSQLRRQATRMRSAGEPLRRSWYLQGLAWRPPAAKEMRVFGLGDWVTERHRDEWLEGMEPVTRDLRRMTWTVFAASFLVLAVYGGIIGYVAWAAVHHLISLREIAIVLPMLPTSMNAGSVSYADTTLERQLASIPDLDGLTRKLRAAAHEYSGDVRATRLPASSIRFDGLSFTYPGEAKPILDGLELELRAGESLGLVGVNGAGKTTLVTLLARMREPTGGQITVDGIPLRELVAREWQRQVAVVYQDYARLPLTAAENVAMFSAAASDPDDRPDRAQLERAAKRAAALAVIDGLPNGWDTVLSSHYRGGIEPSGGQWQRLALARALYAVQTGARMLVLDEPTAQLDVRGEAAFYERFLDLTAGVTSIVISHRFASVRRANRIAVLDGGRITELGTHDELLALDGTYAAMFRLQAERFAAEERER